MTSNTGILLAQIAAWNVAHPSAKLDPQALLAVARQEGLSGAIGDGGHAVGPYQLNDSGGVITGLFPGESADQLNAWAWSPAGINFALRHIASVAGGLTGGDAVSNIVSRFERPANIPRETANALAALGLPAPAGSPQGGLGSLPTQPAAAGLARQAALQTQALTALRAMLAQAPARVAAVTPNFVPLTQASVAPAPVAAFSSPLLMGSYGSPLASLAR